ncbi:hypothetical protein ANMWB30_24120 [Arthrobacter sp. MWB30]|nr:hypothetical protein ANMWB30_24120 [Arthrobacter sp. MWB30]
MRVSTHPANNCSTDVLPIFEDDVAAEAVAAAEHKAAANTSKAHHRAALKSFLNTWADNFGTETAPDHTAFRNFASTADDITGGRPDHC